MFMRYEDGLGFQKKLRHSASWRCGFSHQMKCQLNNNVVFFKGVCLSSGATPKNSPPQPTLLVQHRGCILGPFYFTRNGKTQGFYWDIDPCLCQIWWSWWDPVDWNHQISGSVDDLGSLVSPILGEFLFFRWNRGIFGCLWRKSWVFWWTTRF